MNTLRNHFIKSSTGGKPNYTIYYTADLKVPFIGGSQKRGLTMWETGDESEPLATFEVVGDSFADGYGEWGIKTSNPSCFYGLIKDKNGYGYSMDSGNFNTITGLIFPDYDYDNNYITEIGGPLLGDGEGNSLTDVTLPFHLEYLGLDTFKGSVNLQTIIIPPYVETISNNCFKNCSSLTAFCCDALTPPVLNGLDIFGNFNTIPNLKIYVGFVEDYLQNEDWSKYANIIYLDPCIISYKATGCSYFNLNNVTPSSYTYYAYYNGRGFMRFSKEVTAINGQLFSTYDVAKVSNVYLPNTITSIGEAAFRDCSSLTSIVIPENVTSIGDGAFSYCSSLASVTIGNSVTSIGELAFYECKSLTSITIPNSVTSIGRMAFYGCSSLTSVIIGSNVINIEFGSLAKCKSLVSIDVEESNPNYSSIEGVLFNKNKTILIQCPPSKQGVYTIPNSVTSIGFGAFSYCSSLTSVVIPNSVTSVGEAAFSDCTSLTSIIIPNSVTNIENSVFYMCDNLNMLTYNGTKLQWNTITKSTYWDTGLSATVVHCTDGDVIL